MLFRSYQGTTGSNGGTGPQGYQGYQGSTGNPFGGGTFTGAVTMNSTLSVTGATSHTGNVGIGTSSPGYKLDVNGLINTNDQFRSTGGGGDLRVNGNFGGTIAGIGMVGSNPVMFFTNNTERARLDASGNFLVTGVGGLGYGTGSGGSVTQGTSRTTGVTLNKTNGDRKSTRLNSSH